MIVTYNVQYSICSIFNRKEIILNNARAEVLTEQYNVRIRMVNTLSSIYEQVDEHRKGAENT